MSTTKTSDSKSLEFYYTLNFCVSDGLHKKGDSIAASTDDVRIGQTTNCLVLLENRGVYEDECFAVVRKGRIRGQWLIVPVSEYVKTYVNGTEIVLQHYLNEGDRISFEGESQELVFHIHMDGRFDVTHGAEYRTVSVSRRIVVFLVCLPIVLSSLLALYVVRLNNRESAEQAMLDAVRPDVLSLSVDTVLYVRQTSNGECVIRRFSYVSAMGSTVNGTAFLTADKRIVTARHCIEPWLNDMSVYSMETPNDIESLPARWALEAETYNQLHDNDTTYRVVSVCRLFRGTFGTENFGDSWHSSDFCYDTSRDDIVEKGDFDHVYYWRSIVETYSMKEMMLGDVAWTATDSVGHIYIPSDEMLGKWFVEKQRLDFMGYPDYKTMGFETVRGQIQLQPSQNAMIAHNGSLLHGYSGGPALVMSDGKVYAVGVISRIDPSGGERMYSVPINQLVKKSNEK